ncbi:MAG TPA: helix-turn-helix domain-containing protein, partial [Candidatus Omnitrophota bacterium]|nr:helix-turn-helix domain-containing protein [Candidatus Omnitrophota bacterium]
GISVALTKMEFNILAFLMENKGKVISRADLVGAIWGKGAVVNDININMHIRAIRQKLGKSKNCIETVRGYGYRFSAHAKD